MVHNCSQKWSLQNILKGVPPTWGCVFWNVKRVHRSGELGYVVIHITDSDINSHIWGLKTIICPNQQRIFGTAFPVQPLGRYQISRFRVNAETVISSTNDSVRDQSICTLRKRPVSELLEVEQLRAPFLMLSMYLTKWGFGLYFVRY